jgi:hypothetical protein
MNFVLQVFIAQEALYTAHKIADFCLWECTVINP